MEENKTLKQELLEKAEKLVENSENTNVFQELNELKRKWKRSYGDDESLFDKELDERFDKVVAKLQSVQAATKESVETIKADIIEKAKELAESNNFKAATQKMNDLFSQWKAAGRGDKDSDDSLWQQFQEVRDQFFAKKKDYYENLTANFENNKVAKEELIAKAKEVLNMEKISEGIKEINSLMEQWKKTGSAGRDNDDDLWSQFSQARSEFFKKKNEYFANMKEVYAQRAKDKEEIISQAKVCLARSTFSAEEVETIKSLRTKWKEVGFAGKDNEDDLWKEFSDIMNRYFENKKVYGQN